MNLLQISLSFFKFQQDLRCSTPSVANTAELLRMTHRPAGACREQKPGQGRHLQEDCSCGKQGDHPQL